MDRRKLLLIVAAVVAALGVALVFVYARGAETRAANKFDAVDVLTATQKIAPGESLDQALKSGKIELKPVAKSQRLEGSDSDAGPLSGKVALTTLYPGEQIIPVKFGALEDVEAASVLPIPEGKLAISIQVEDDARVGDFIEAGAEIAIIQTRPKKPAAPITSRILLERVTVLADGVRTLDTGTADAGGDGAGDTVRRLVTVAVTQREAERVRFAERDGDLSIALLNDASKVQADDGVDSNNLYK